MKESPAPETSGVCPVLPRLEGIRLVSFDLYGTLLVSAAGGEENRQEERVGAMKAALVASGRDGSNAELWLEAFDRSIGRAQDALRRSGVDFPEVEIRDVWRSVFQEFGFHEPRADEIEAFARDYENGSNPCGAMPGAVEIVERISAGGLALGIVSNAQFYTEMVVQEVLGFQMDIGGFDAKCCIFSFEHGQGKPSTKLFEILTEAANSRGIRGSEIVHIGNDLEKDVLPAKAVGLRAILFAGDARSLRTGGRSMEHAASMADAVLTDLAQLGDVVGLQR